MITFEVFVGVIVAVSGIYALANVYVLRSLRSYASADVALARIDGDLAKLIASEVPVGVARVAFMLAATAGCGCYVRGVLYSHYLPSPLARLIAGGPRRGSTVENDLFQLNDLSKDQRSLFSALIVSVIVYDGYRNPFSGWAFRRLMDAYAQSSFTERADAEVTAVSIVSRKKPEKVSALQTELCTA